jgi:hypothetical protein
MVTRRAPDGKFTILSRRDNLFPAATDAQRMNHSFPGVTTPAAPAAAAPPPAFGPVAGSAVAPIPASNSDMEAVFKMQGIFGPPGSSATTTA